MSLTLLREKQVITRYITFYILNVFLSEPKAFTPANTWKTNVQLSRDVSQTVSGFCERAQRQIKPVVRGE